MFLIAPLASDSVAIVVTQVARDCLFDAKGLLSPTTILASNAHTLNLEPESDLTST